MKELSEKVISAIKIAAKKLTGVKRRSYQAEITNGFFGGNARKAEQEMGWGRETVKKGLKESESGILCADNFRGRGRKKNRRKTAGFAERYPGYCRTSCTDRSGF